MNKKNDMKPSLISCIVPVFNGERYLKETINSILEQTYRPLEIIVADDGSTDGTAKVVANYKEQVFYLWQPNAGTAAARNLGLSAAKGEFVAFLDADDLWHPEKLARQMARFHERPELDFCITHVQNFWIPELVEEEKQFRNNRRSKPLPGYTTYTLLARRILFEKIGQFITTLRHSDDTEWFLRASERGAVKELLPDVLAYRRLHHNNLSRLHSSASVDEYLRLVKASLDRRRRQNTTSSESHKIPKSEKSD
jgi:glycosyltransferase involved in cell wall biosynthesis